MKVKIGNKIFDSENQPIMVILTDIDKQNIVNMSTECTKYASYPETMSESEIQAWMDEDSPFPLD